MNHSLQQRQIHNRKVRIVSRPVIVAENLSKLYQIGLLEERHQTFREAIMQTAAAPFQRLRRLSGGGRGDDRFWAMRDVSFKVPPGEVVGIVGRNGAGKSTLLKVLSRITEPTEGRVTIRGRVGSLLEVGTGFHTELTGRENVYLNGSILGMSRREIDRKFDEIVAFSGVEKFIDTPVKRYSSGMTVRLGFAVAAHLEPEILIVDEVLAVGDAEFQRRCLGKMNEVATSGRTVLFVSHNMAAVEGLCTSAILLSGGTLAAEGDVATVLRLYMSSLTTNAAPDEPAKKSLGKLLRAVRLMDESSQDVSAIQMGEPFSLDVRCWSDRAIMDAVCWLHIYNMYGQRLTTLSTRQQCGDRLTLPAGESSLSCHVPYCSLLPGRYSVLVSLEEHRTRLERIEDALIFDVLPKDVYGTGQTPRESDGVFATCATWHAETSECRS